MKNKMMMMGSLVLVLGLIFVGCEDEFTKAEFDGAGAPKITVTPGTGTDNEKFFLVTWEAVGNKSGYQVVFQPTGKKTYDTLNASTTEGGNKGPTNWQTYNADGTTTSIITETRNVDQWNAWVKIDKSSYDVGTGKIGVLAISTRKDKNNTIGWSDTVTLK
jgi:hypothetical protein